MKGVNIFDSTHVAIDEPEILDYKMKGSKAFHEFFKFFIQS